MNGGRWAWAEIDLDALDHNIKVLRGVVAPASVWAVVKADGYGHGAVGVADQALRSGATGLCVALADEGIELRRAGIDAPILVLSEQPPDRIAELIGAALLIAGVVHMAWTTMKRGRMSDPAPNPDDPETSTL